MNCRAPLHGPLFLLLLVGCEGPVGPVGPPGTPAPVLDAAVVDGAPPPNPDLLLPLPTDPTGLVGRVFDGTGGLVGGGTVYLVPAADVGALAVTAIDLTETPDVATLAAHDEPLEDVIDANGATYAQAVVASNGVYAITAVVDGSYFLVWVPDPGDTAHLAGGSRCREAQASASFLDSQLDIRVSGVPSSSALHIGSTACRNCHGRRSAMHTAHFSGLSVPGARGYLQETRRWPDFDRALAAFESNTTLFFYDCSAMRTGPSKCRVTDAAPAAPAVVSFEARLRRDPAVRVGQPGAYYVRLVDRTGGRSVRHDVAITYGGAVFRQLFVTTVANADGSRSHMVLPFQYNFAGNVTLADFESWTWRDYYSDQWFNLGTNNLRTPDADESFDNKCAPCHMTGFALGGGTATGWVATAVADPNGAYDYDGDSRLEEINVGCESCHGPGSEHVENRVRGSRIVMPSHLTPGRELTICGGCHSRPLGIGGAGSESPIDATGHMPRPGMRRSDYLLGHTSRIDASTADLHASGDSKSNHQQYTDFIRSRMYRNNTILMTCTSCHEAHGAPGQAHDLLFDPTANDGCTACHSAAEFTSVLTHVGSVTGIPHSGVAESEFRCVNCHMVGTATSGARIPMLLDDVPAASPVQYMHGDIASHRFRVPLFRDAPNQPAAVTRPCAVCHKASLRNP